MFQGLGSCYGWEVPCVRPVDPCSAEKVEQRSCPDPVVWFWVLAGAVGVALAMKYAGKR